MKTSELTRAALVWAVAKCEGWEAGKYMMSPDIRKDASGRVIGIMVPSDRAYMWWKPSTDWAQGGPIIEREGMGVWMYQWNEQGEPEVGWYAEDKDGDHVQKGTTPLIAAMRCYVASKLGDEVDLPPNL